MGYIAINQQPLIGKKQPKPQQIKQLDVMLDRLKRWRWATKLLGSYATFALGYRHVALQEPGAWAAALKVALLTPDYSAECKSILALNSLSRLRSALVLFLLYLVTQHGRIQLLISAQGPKDSESGYPLDELDGNHHNLDYFLLRLLGLACNVTDAPSEGKPNPTARMIFKFAGLIMGPGVDKLAPYTMARWVHVADVAGGLAPRSANRIYKNWQSTAAMPSKDLFARTRGRFRETRALASPLMKAILVFGACFAFWLYCQAAHGHLFRFLLRFPHP